MPIFTDKSDVGLSPDAGFVHVAMCFEQLQESFIEILTRELDMVFQAPRAPGRCDQAFDR